MSEQNKCDFCGRTTDVRPFARWANPQRGFWCRECADRIMAAGAFAPNVGGGILFDGWETKEQQFAADE